MSTASFVVSFDGPGVVDGTIDVRDLAPALLALGKVIDAANRALNGDGVPAHVNVKATGEGSFVVDLDLVLSGWAAVKGLLLSPDVQAAGLLLGFIGLTVKDGLIGLYRALRGRRIASARQEGSVVVLTVGEETIIVPLEVLRLYQEIAVNQAVSELLDSFENERISSISFKQSRDSEPSQVITKADRAAFRVPIPEDEIVTDETRRMALSIRSLAFQEGNKWRLYDGQNVITATIADPEFLARVDRNELRFAKSDVLICSVQTIQKQGADGLKTEHVVQKVLDYRPAPQQIDLFATPRDGAL